jgi:hypothetical protein
MSTCKVIEPRAAVSYLVCNARTAAATGRAIGADQRPVGIVTGRLATIGVNGPPMPGIEYDIVTVVIASMLEMFDSRAMGCERKV